MAIPYQLIGMVLGLLLGVRAIIVTESPGGGVSIGVIMAGLFFLPRVWRGPNARMASFLGWIIFGAGCYFFLKWRGAGLR